ncbi:MAG: EthD family reductase [Bacteroidetes bacterium]|nr:EthD family reductase [Bacteroidota bacterium]MCL5268077.1 EthD family reductase [Bacteroidota bacterium]
MVKLVALFKKPTDPTSFEEHYENVHLPLINKMPGMKRIEISKVTGAPMTQPQFYRMAEMYFDDQNALNTAIVSPEGMASAKDLMGFARDVVQIFFAEVRE